MQFRYELTARNSPSTSSLDFNTSATSLYDPASTAAAPQAVPQTGFGLANLFIGAGNYSATFGRPWVFMRRNELAPYIQDTWRITSRLTLNLGLRWDLRTPTYDHDNALQSFDLAKKAYVLSTPMSRFLAQGNTLPSIVAALQNLGGKIENYTDAGLPERLQNNQWKNIGPRLGFAYRALGGREAFVLRGGYRISTYPQPSTNWLPSQNGTQLTNGSFPYSVTNTTLSPDGLPNYGLRSVPQYVAGLNTPSSIININETRLLTRGSFDAVRLNPGLRDPKVHDWNLTFEKEIMQATVVRRRPGRQPHRQPDADPGSQRLDRSLHLVHHAAEAAAYRRVRQCGDAARSTSRCTAASTNTTAPATNGTTEPNSSWSAASTRESDSRFSITWPTRCARPVRCRDPGQFPAGRRSGGFRFTATGSSTTSATPPRPKHQIRWNFIADLPFGKGKLLGRNAARCARQGDRRLADRRHGKLENQLLEPAHGQRLSDRVRRSKSTATSTRSRTAPAAPASPATCGGTAIFRRTGSTATTRRDSRTAIWGCLRTTSPRRPS